MIQSSPPGATILVNGERSGRTPRFVDLKRGFSNDIQLKSRDGNLPVPLLTSYRWSKSFFGNMVFLSAAPIGWIWDFASGAAWDISDGPPVSLNLTEADSKARKDQQRDQKIAVIAPPQAESLELSDAGAHELEIRLRSSHPQLNIRPFSETLPTFTENGYDFDSDHRGPQPVYSVLNSDFVYESKVEAVGDAWKLSSEQIDVYSKDREPGPSLMLDYAKPGDRLIAAPNWWSRLLPNTVGLDFLSDRVEIRQKDKVYEFTPTDDDAWWSKGLRYISAINISNVPARRRDSVSRWTWGAVPSLRLSHRKVKANGLPIPPGEGFYEKDPELARWLVSGGYGGEIAYQVGRHIFYVDLVPIFYWSQIEWRDGGRSRSASGTGAAIEVELGYLLYVDSNWIFRLMTRTQSENAELWQEALRDRFAQADGNVEVSRVTGGFSVAYRFGPSFQAPRK